jgi:hypothetical protein
VERSNPPATPGLTTSVVGEALPEERGCSLSFRPPNEIGISSRCC